MSRIARWFGATVPSKLGLCSFCMRSAFVSAATAWLGTIVSAFLAPRTVTALLAAGALALTALWIAHLIAYSLRRISGPGAREAVDPARRGLFVAFGRVFLLAAVATSLPAGVARADKKCCTHTYSCLGPNGEAPCCDEDTPYLCTTDCKCYADTSTCNSYYKCTD